MDAFKEGLKEIIDYISKALSWVDSHVPGFVKALIPGYGALYVLRDVLEVVYFLVADGGDPTQLRQAAQVLQQYASTLTEFSNTTVTVSGLAATDPNVWTDVNASTAYVQRIQDLAQYFADAEQWSQAIATGLDGDADVIEKFYQDLHQALLSMVADVISVVLAAAPIIVELLSVVGASVSAAQIAELAVAILDLVSDFYKIDDLRTMEAPTISPTAEGHAWPTPVLW